MENNGKQLEPKKTNARRLTDKNWLFIKHYLDLGDAPTAHKMAGYQGSSIAAPYEMVLHLKPEIEMIAEERGLGKAKMVSKVARLIDQPLRRVTKDGETELTGLTPAEHMKAIELALKLTKKDAKESTALSPVTIVTNAEGKTQVNFGKGDGGKEKKKGQGRIEGEAGKSEDSEAQHASSE